MEDENLELDALNQDNTDTGTDDTQDEESIDYWKAKAQKAEEDAAKKAEYAQNMKIRAEKAEKNPKNGAAPAPKESAETTVTADQLALIRAGVPAEDDEVVIKYSKGTGISVKEALSDPILQEILKRNSDERKAASATHVGNAARGSAKVSDEQLLANAKKGDLPESDADLARLISLQKMAR